ncbi:hypothetical protein GCM10017691_33300 [Pseudonocardia petroleophila]
MSRHRHTVNVRADGLRAVLGPLLRDRRVVTAVLVDVDSGMVLDAWSSHLGRTELELLGAGHAELVRTARGGARGPDQGCEVVVSHGDDWHHVVRTVPDPHGDHLALAVVVAGRRRVLERARRRLRVVSTPALTAGPTMSRRPDALRRPDPEAVPEVAPDARGGGAPMSVASGSARAGSGAAGPAAVGGVRRPDPDGPGPDGRGQHGSGQDGSGPVRPGSGGRTREDAALLSLGGAFRPEGPRAALDLGGDVLPPRAPVLRAVPPTATAPAPPGPVPRSDRRPDRPRAPISALAPGPRRQHPADG